MDRERLKKVVSEIKNVVEGVISSVYQIDYVTDCNQSALVGTYDDGERKYEDKGKFLTATARLIADKQKRKLLKCVQLFNEYTKLVENVTKLDGNIYHDEMKRNLHGALEHSLRKGYLGIAKKFAEIYAGKTFQQCARDKSEVDSAVRNIIEGYAKRGIINGDKGREYRERAINVMRDAKLGYFGEAAKELKKEELLNFYNKTTVFIDRVAYGVEKPIKENEIVTVSTEREL